MTNKKPTLLTYAARFGGGALGVAALTLGTAGVAGAQDAETPSVEQTEEVSEHQERKAEKRAAIAEAIGIGVEELKEARQDGSTLAEIAGDELPAVVDVFVDSITGRVDAAVESGRITQDQADEKLADLEERVESRLEDGEGHKRKGRKGFGRKGSMKAEAVETLDA